MKVAVFSGGGADGAITVGRLSVTKPDFDMAGCSSTGSLLGPLALLKEYGRLEQSYISANMGNIIEKSVFNANGKPNFLKAVAYGIETYMPWGSASLGESTALRKKIREEFTYEDYLKLNDSGKECLVAAYSLSFDEMIMFGNRSRLYEDYIDWMWASANVPGVASILKKKRIDIDSLPVEQWGDGGIESTSPIEETIRAAQRRLDLMDEPTQMEVDVYMHYPKFKGMAQGGEQRKTLQNIGHTFMRMASSKIIAANKRDIRLGKLAAQASKAILRIHWIDREYYPNSLVFNEKKMEHLLDVGRSIAREPSLIETFDYSEKGSII